MEKTERELALEKQVEELKATNDKLMQASAQKDAEALVDAAIAAGKLNAAQKESFVALALAKPEETKKAIEGLQANATRPSDKFKEQPLNTSATQMLAQVEFVPTDLKAATYDELWKKHPKVLERIKNEQPEVYQALYDAQYKQGK